MNPPFFYQLRGTLFRSPDKKYKLVEVDKTFKDDNPLEARKKVFAFYQNYVDVLLESRGKEYSSHEQAVDELQDFVNSYQHEYADSTQGNIINTDFDKGLYIYLVFGDSSSFDTTKGETVYENKILIHYFNNKLSDFRGFVFKSLQRELDLYTENKIDCSGSLMKFNIAGKKKLPIFREVLETPIDFNKVFEDED